MHPPQVPSGDGLESPKTPLDPSPLRSSPRSLEGGSINPETGAPEREIIGIGAVVVRENGMVLIKDVLPGSPAALADLSGCAIQRVNDVSVYEMPLAECVRLIRGLEGSTVKIEVIDRNLQPQTIQLVRTNVTL